jgi:hypothetical protein
VAKRLFWLMLGFGLGVGVTVRASRTLQRALERSLPPATYAQLRALGRRARRASRSDPGPTPNEQLSRNVRAVSWTRATQAR